MSFLSKLRPAALRASVVALAAVAFASSASAYQCLGAPSVDFRQLQTFQPQVMQFMIGTWQDVSPDSFGNMRRGTYSFDAAGNYTQSETVCAAGYCTPRVLRGFYAAYSMEQGVLSLAILNPGSGCSVSRLRVVGRDAIVGVNQPPGTAPMQRVSGSPQ